MLQTKIKDNELAQQMLHLVVPIAIQQFMLALVSATDPVCPQSLYRRHCCRMRYHYRAILGKKRHHLHRKGHAGSALYQPDLRRDFYRTGFVYSKPPHADLYQRCNPDCQRHLLFKSRCIFLCPLWHFADLFDPFKKYRACGA